MRILALALVAVLGVGCATVQRRGEPATTEWDGSGGGLWTPPSGIFLNQAQQNGGNDYSIGNLVVNGTARFNGAVTIAANVLPSASNTFGFGSTGLTFTSIALSTGVRDSNAVTRYATTSATSGNAYTGAVANSATNSAHNFGNVNALSGTTRLFQWFRGNQSDLAIYANSSGKMVFNTTDTTGTPGDASINTPVGQFSIGAGAGAAGITITASGITTASVILPVIQTADATCTFIKTAVPGTNQFVVTTNANCTGQVNVGFITFN